MFGGFEPSLHLAMGLADKIAIITVMNNVLPAGGNVASRILTDRSAACGHRHPWGSAAARQMVAALIAERQGIPSVWTTRRRVSWLYSHGGCGGGRTGRTAEKGYESQ